MVMIIGEWWQITGLDALFACPVLMSAMLDAGQEVRVIAGFDDSCLLYTSDAADE